MCVLASNFDQISKVSSQVFASGVLYNLAQAFPCFTREYNQNMMSEHSVKVRKDTSGWIPPL